MTSNRLNSLFKKIKIFQKLANATASQQHGFKKTAIAIRPTDRVNLSHIKFNMGRFILSQDEDYANNKPNAFYYAFGKQWINFIDFQSGDVYILDLNMTRMYHLTPENLEDFIKKYCKEVSTDEYIQSLRYFGKEIPTGTVIDWKKFKSDYDGMEITDLDAIKEKFLDLKIGSYMRFIDSVDVDGGFFWNPSALNHATKIGTVEEGGKIKPVDITRRYRFEEDLEIGSMGGENRESFIPRQVDESTYWGVIHTLRDKGYPFPSKLPDNFFHSFSKWLEKSGGIHEVYNSLGTSVAGITETIKNMLRDYARVIQRTRYDGLTLSERESQMNTNLSSPAPLTEDEIIESEISTLSRNILFYFFTRPLRARFFMLSLVEKIFSRHAPERRRENIKETLQYIFVNLTPQELKDLTDYVSYATYQYEMRPRD